MPIPAPGSPFYITTPIYYVNDKPHVGHCYTTIVADAIARFQRMAGKDVFFLTGTDEHGQKVEKSAQARGITAQQLADENAEHFKAALGFVGSSNDDFIRTTEPRHEKQVVEAISRLLKSGDIYLGEFEGWYDEGQEEYVPENTAREKGYKAFNGSPLVKAKEENYYFRLSKYQGWLKDYIAANPEFISPEARKNEVLGRLNLPEGLQDVPVSRTNFSWGIPLPVPAAKDGAKHVTYVWIDALLNYASAVGLIDENALPAEQRGRKKYWPASVHLIGKEILWFHAVIWPAMLKALGLELPGRIYAHSFWIRDGKKMSKTLGNFIDLETIKAYCGAYGVDAWRWFMLTQGPLEATDADFSHAKFVEVYNADLANGIGNAFSRVSNMIEKYFGGKCPESKGDIEGCLNPDSKLRQMLKELLQVDDVVSDVTRGVSELDVEGALQSALGQSRFVDAMIHETEPFKRAKETAKMGEVATILYEAAERLRIAAILLSPAMPTKMAEILRRFGQEVPDAQGRFSKPLSELCQWGGLKPGTPIVKGEGLFPRIDPAAPAPTSAAS
ncbi:MAG: class I tRNA ligase family protein [Phycisphaerales bacterium]